MIDPESISERSSTFPSWRAVDYGALLREAGEQRGDPANFLRRELPFKWRDVYVAAMAHATNIVCFQFRTFEYICDLYSELEATGEVPYDQTIEDRALP
jgi:hypothetical protein